VTSLLSSQLSQPKKRGFIDFGSVTVNNGQLDLATNKATEILRRTLTSIQRGQPLPPQAGFGA